MTCYCTAKERLADFKNYQDKGIDITLVDFNENNYVGTIIEINETNIKIKESQEDKVEERIIEFKDILDYTPTNAYNFLLKYKDICTFSYYCRNTLFGVANIISLNITSVILETESIYEPEILHIDLRDIYHIDALSKESKSLIDQYSL